MSGNRARHLRAAGILPTGSTHATLGASRKRLPRVFALTGKPLPESLNLSRLWPAAIQGLATGVLGACFVRHDGKT